MGKFFDQVDREYLRLNERLDLNSSSELLPCISVSTMSITTDDDFEPVENLFFTSTPVRLDNPDLDVFGSPVGESADSTLSVSVPGFDVPLMPTVAANLDSVMTSDTSLSDLDTQELPDWVDRDIKCMKFVDDCLSIKKINLKKMCV